MRFVVGVQAGLGRFQEPWFGSEGFVTPERSGRVGDSTCPGLLEAPLSRQAP